MYCFFFECLNCPLLQIRASQANKRCAAHVRTTFSVEQCITIFRIVQLSNLTRHCANAVNLPSTSVCHGVSNVHP